jgi:hypothetical protein
MCRLPLISHKNFVSKLQQHLLPRIRELLVADGSTLEDPSERDGEKVVLNLKRIYAHHTMRINFTTYDVRRATDVINTHGPRCNIMGLKFRAASSPLDSEPDDDRRHPFWYAKVLGIFHANVMYLGQKNRDHRPRRIEFLWVRWYEVTKAGSWTPQRLDQVCFPSVSEEDSFGFLDPADVLRGCHIIPSFKAGMRFPDGSPSHSNLAQDANDWKLYFVNR